MVATTTLTTVMVTEVVTIDNDGGDNNDYDNSHGGGGGVDCGDGDSSDDERDCYLKGFLFWLNCYSYTYVMGTNP